MNLIIHPQTSAVWSLGMDKYFHPTLYSVCNYSSMLGSRLNHVSKRSQGYFTEAIIRLRCCQWNQPWRTWVTGSAESIKISKCNHNKTKHNKTVCVFHGTYSSCHLDDISQRTRRNNNVIMTSFWRHHGVIIASCAHWDSNDGVMTWKHYPHHWLFVRGKPPVTSRFPAQGTSSRSFHFFCC